MPTYQIEYELIRDADDLPAGIRTAELSAPDHWSAASSLGAILSLREGLVNGTLRVRKVTLLSRSAMFVRRISWMRAALASSILCRRRSAKTCAGVTRASRSTRPSVCVPAAHGTLASSGAPTNPAPPRNLA